MEQLAHQAQSGTDFFSMDNTVPSNEPIATHTDEVKSEKPDLTTEFMGVYVNTHKNNDQFKYRTSISQYNSFSKQTFWINLGYFNCPLVAALAYNTAALGMYMGKAKLNYIADLSACGQEELAEFKTKRALRIRIAQVVTEAVNTAGEKFDYVNLP